MREAYEQWLAVSMLAVVGFSPMHALAEEGGSGHYLPGSISDFSDGVPQNEGFYLKFNGVDYLGSAGITKQLPFAGVAVGGPKADVWGAGLSLVWRPNIDFGQRWSYAMSVTVPYIGSNVSASAIGSLPSGLSRSLSESSNTDALGDIVLMPLMVNYNVDPDFNVNFRVGFYAPTGSYEIGRLANTGKNFWTTEPMLGLMYFGKTTGIEASAYIGADFNTEDNATHYQSGTQFHIDGTLAQHFPVQGGLAGVGISAYDYQQVTPDTGSGATLGAFEAKSIGLGPVLSYITKIAGHDTTFEVKWLHEAETEDRLEGNIFWLKALTKF
jgi:hypothetical protein